MSAINKRPPPDWDAEAQAMWRKNAKEVPRQVTEKERGMMRRVRTYCGRFGYGMRKVIAKIRDDKMFAACFSKDPGKQGMHEAIAAEYLREEKGISNFKILPKTGEMAAYIKANGSIVSGGERPEGAFDSKSLDFSWKTAGVVCYASHKYTHEGGGAQNHQFKEQKQFLQNFKKHADKRVAFFAICDGQYYNGEKMGELAELARKRPPLSFALHIEDVGAALRKVASMTDNCKQ